MPRVYTRIKDRAMCRKREAVVVSEALRRVEVVQANRDQRTVRCSEGEAAWWSASSATTTTTTEVETTSTTAAASHTSSHAAEHLHDCDEC
jgi:hypothetical protein